MLSPGRKVGKASGIEKTNTNCTNAGWAKTNTESAELTETQRKNSCYSCYSCSKKFLCFLCILCSLLLSAANAKRNTLNVYARPHVSAQETIFV